MSEPKTAMEALRDADEAWTQALDEGANVGDPDELRLTSLLAFGSDEGVAIMRDGTLRGLRPARCFCAGVPAGTITDDTHWKMLPAAPSRTDERPDVR